MGNFTYLMDDDNEVVKKADDVVATATDTADAATLGPANAVILPISLPWRSNGVGAKSLILDFGTAITADFVAVVGHNISADATELRAFADSSTPPGATNEIDMLAGHLGPGSSWGLRAAGAFTQRYWSIEITDASNPDGYYEVGYVVLGVATELGFNMNFDWNEQWIYKNRQNPGSPFYGEQLEDYSKISLTFGNLLKTERDILKKFLKGFNGSRKPAFLVPDPDDNFGMFGRLEGPGQVPFTHRNKGVIDGAAVSFVEDNRGIRINV